VEAATGMPINFQFMPEGDIAPGMQTAFGYDSSSIFIMLPQGTTRIGRRWEHSVYHEATHGLLLFNQGYHTFERREALTSEETKLAMILGSIVDDIVVNKIVSEEGVQPFGYYYLQTVKQENMALKNGRDPYAAHLKIGPDFGAKFKICRYILAWSFLEHFRLVYLNRRLLRRYLRLFSESFPDQIPETEKSVDLISSHNIFSPQGHGVVIREISRLWGISGKVAMVVYS
jgi:hypothetical protein